MFTNTGNLPAKLIKEFRKKYDKPVLKGAFVEESIYVGDNQIDALVSVKSKEELIGRSYCSPAITGEKRYLRTPIRWKYYSWCS